MEEIIQKATNTSPNYEQQEEEIEVLKNILPEKVTVLKTEPNFHIQIEIEGENNEEEEHFKTFYLEIYLNNNYPEKAPRFKIYEANDCLNDKRKDMLIKKLDEYCKENEGISMIYQLYEIVKEFADEEEKISLRKKKYEKIGKIKYELNNLAKINQIKINDTYPIDIFELKDENILVVFKNGIIKVYDNHLGILIFELLKQYSNSPIIFSKYFNFSFKDSMIYLIGYQFCLIFKIIYLSKKTIVEEEYYKINGKIKIEYFNEIKTSDVIEFPQYHDSFFYTSENNKKILLYKSNKNYITKEEISTNPHLTNFRKAHYINSDKFILASYTTRKRVRNEISDTGKNIMCLVETKNFTIKKTYDIKISPLNSSIETYKNKYVIISYFNTIEEGENLPNQEEIDDLFDEYYYKKNIYSYDIKQHYIGIYSIEYEVFITIIEYHVIKRIYNINDYLLCQYIRKEKNNENSIIECENIFQEYNNYYNYKSLDSSEDNKKDQYLVYISFDSGINIINGCVDYDDITSFKELGKHYFSICYKKKGVILYSERFENN